MLSTINGNLIFDFDYTLAVVPSSDIQRCEILSKYCNIPKNQLMKTMWDINSDYGFVVKILNGTQEIKNAYNEILDLNFNLAHYVYILPSLYDAIKNLSFHFNLFTYSGRDTKSLILAMKKIGLNKYFKEIIGSDKGNFYKPHPQIVNAVISRYNMKLNDTIYIGDKSVDRDLAANVGCKFIQAKWYRWFTVENVVECYNPQNLQRTIDKISN